MPEEEEEEEYSSSGDDDSSGNGKTGQDDDDDTGDNSRTTRIILGWTFGTIGFILVDAVIVFVVLYIFLFRKIDEVKVEDVELDVKSRLAKFEKEVSSKKAIQRKQALKRMEKERERKNQIHINKRVSKTKSIFNLIL